MRHAGLAALLLAASCAAAPKETGASRPVETRTRDGARLRAETFVGGLEVPWSLAFTSATRLLVTERPGRVRVVENGVLRPEPLARIEETESSSEMGLMGLALAPDYEKSRAVYLSYSYRGPRSIAVRVERYRDEGTRLAREKTIVEGIPAARFHAGSRLRFGPDGKLYVTTGDATSRELAQRLDSLAGKTLRVEPDGSVPADNPFPGSPVFSFGHRNAQGLDWHVPSGLQFQTEHGPSGFDGPGGGDEVNVVEKGKNYGWPLVHHRQVREGTVAPLIEFTPAVAPAGGSFVPGGRLPTLAGNFLFATLRGEKLVRVVLDRADPRRVAATEDLFAREFGRLREVIPGPDGAMYVTTSNRDGRGDPRGEDDRILRLTEVGR